VRPWHVKVIGLGFGLNVVCPALRIKDSGEGSLCFLEPAYSLFKEDPFKGGKGI